MDTLINPCPNSDLVTPVSKGAPDRVIKNKNAIRLKYHKY